MYKVLYVDDEPDLQDIARHFLESTGDFSVETHTGAPEVLPAIGTNGYDAIISDYQMPDMDGIAFLKAVRSMYGDLPFILFTGRGREEVVIEAINNGADFYIQNGGDPRAQFAELAHHVRQAVTRKRAQDQLLAAYEQIALAERELRGKYDELAQSERQIRESEASYRGLFNTIGQAIYIQDPEWKFIDVNDGAVIMYGYNREEFIGRTPEFFAAPGKNDLAANGELMKKAFAGVPQQFVFWAKKKNGEIFKKDVRVYKGTYFGRDVLIAIGTDISGKRQGTVL